MRVEEVMTTELVTAPATASLANVMGVMLEECVGSVVITRDDNPTGIVTETDALKIIHKHDLPPSKIPVHMLIGDGLIMIEPDASIKMAVRRMKRANVKKLPVVSDMNVLGIITMTDIVYNHTEALKEVRELTRNLSRRNTRNWD